MYPSILMILKFQSILKFLKPLRNRRFLLIPNFPKSLKIHPPQMFR